MRRYTLLAILAIAATIFLATSRVPQVISSPFRFSKDGIRYAAEEARSSDLMTPAHAAVDGNGFQISNPVSAIYKLSPSTLVDGDQDVLHTDAAHNLLVTMAGKTGASSTQVQGAGAAAAAVVGNPVLVGGSDGTNARSIATDTSGRVKSLLLGNGAATLDQAPGSAIPTNAVMVGGSDGTNLRAVAMDTSGDVKALLVAGSAAVGTVTTVGGAASGSALSGNPNLIAGGNGTNAYTLTTDQNGFLQQTLPKNAWYVTANTAATANTTPSASKAAGAAGVQHVATHVHAVLFGDSTGNADHVILVLRDGATGAGTIVQEWQLTLATGANANGTIIDTPVATVGTAATAMTLELTGADATHSICILALDGYDIKP